MQSWFLIESPPAEVSRQMEWDRELFEKFLGSSRSLPVLRIYQASKPAITVGRSWPSNGKVCIRPTGGGRVRHGNDLIYSVIAWRNTFPTFAMVRTSYLSFHEVVQETFQKFGVETRLVRCDERKRGKSSLSPLFQDCFENPVATDVLVGERKIAGGAQWRRGKAFLHQGSIQLLEGVTFESLKQEFVSAFQNKFKVRWQNNEVP